MFVVAMVGARLFCCICFANKRLAGNNSGIQNGGCTKTKPCVQNNSCVTLNHFFGQEGSGDPLGEHSSTEEAKMGN